MEIPYLYRGKVVSVTDGDTVVIELDLGFNIRIVDAFRLYGINAPETSTDEGKVAKKYLADKIPPGTSIVVQTHKNTKEKYGRWLARLWLVVDGKDVNLNADMVANGHAKVYMENLKGF